MQYREAARVPDFESAIRDRITEYRRFATSLQRQRSSLSFTIHCELAKGGGGGATSLLAGGAASGMFSQMQTAMGAGTLLLAGCLWASIKIQELKPLRDQLRSAEAEFKDNVCFGLHNFYRQIGSAVGSDVRA